MYGTVAHLSAKPGTEAKMRESMREYESVKIPGAIATYIYRMDSNPNEYFMTVVFEDKDTYFANAHSPEQDARYRRLLDNLVKEPEWHDGEIVYSGVFSKSGAM